MSKQQYRRGSLAIFIFFVSGCAGESTKDVFNQRGASGANCPKKPSIATIPEIRDTRDGAACLIAAQMREVQVMGIVGLLSKGCKFDLNVLQREATEYGARLEECTDYQVKQVGKVR